MEKDPGMSRAFLIQDRMAGEATYEGTAIRTAEDLLDALNRVKRAEFGPKTYPFTLEQLRHFADPRRNCLGYHSFTIPKKSGGKREICAPGGGLKKLQTIAGRLLQGMYEAPQGVTGFIPGRSVADNAALHTGRNYVFNADLKDFFPSILRIQVQSALMKAPFDLGGEAAWLLSGLCCTHLDLAASSEDIRNMIDYGGRGLTVYDYQPAGFPCLPQGSPASPVLSNAVCLRLDRRLSGLAERFGLAYSRYADDITFSGDHNVFREGDAFMKAFRQVVAEDGFTLNEGKLRLQEKGRRQEVTGLIVNRRVNLCRKDIRAIGSLLYIWERYGYDDAYLRFIRAERRRLVYGPGAARKGPVLDGPYDPIDMLVEQANIRPNMVGIIQGRLAYMKMVRGEGDPVWARLDARFRKLKEEYSTRKLVGTRPTYLHSWTIAHFEAVTGAKFKLSKSWDGARWNAYLDLGGGFRTGVSTSRYCRTRLEAAADDPEALGVLKGEFHIGLCLSISPEARIGIAEDAGLKTVDKSVKKTLDKLMQTYYGTPVYWKVFRKVPKHPRKLKVTGLDERRERLSPDILSTKTLMEELGLEWTSVEFGNPLTDFE